MAREHHASAGGDNDDPDLLLQCGLGTICCATQLVLLMPLGIKPTVDFAFKKIFGSPQNSAALIGLLNAILELKESIVAVEVLNPFNYQEFAESKLIVLAGVENPTVGVSAAFRSRLRVRSTARAVARH
ncbi:MAG: PD-(D/E)XK nuclease family transposase [Pirellulaceae bacterium]|nr:PD-(D/E)XK nuclease family transposase [Pirellulaceae bacterium]